MTDSKGTNSHRQTERYNTSPIQGSSNAAHFGHLAHFFGEKYPENYAEILAHLHVLGGALRPQRSFPGRCAQLLIGRELWRADQKLWRVDQNSV